MPYIVFDSVKFKFYANFIDCLLLASAFVYPLDLRDHNS